MTARQTALVCDDILATIFDHLTPDPCDGEDATEKLRLSCRKALASSARVCSTLSHHALNVLWQDLESIHPLLKTLPNCRRIGWQLTLCGGISDEDWTRFQLYANRVRAIVGTMEPERMDLIHPSIWLYLSARCKGSPLVPNLRDIVALDVRTSETPALILLMSPSLHSLNIFFALKAEVEESLNAPHVAASLLQTLPLMAPNLKTFYYDIDISVGHRYVKEFRHFARLDSLSISSELGLDEGALRMLPAIVTLRNLSVHIDLSRSSSLALRPYTFSHLTELTVSGRCDDLTAFIGACQLPALTDITLSVKQLPRAGELVDSFAAMCRRFDPALLTSFSTTIIPAPGSGRLMQYIEPLAAFPNIEKFDLWSSSVIPSIYDDDLARFGAAWPRLTRFHVSHLVSKLDVLPPGFVPPTLSGLVELARRCPHLEAFRTPVLDASVVPEEHENAPLPLGHGLRSLSIGDNVILPSPKSRAFSEVVRVLDRVFPSLKLEDALTKATKNMKGWDKVMILLKTLRLRREA